MEDLEIGVADVVGLRHDADVRVVDVREAEELADGVIPGALHVPLGEVPSRIGDLDRALPTVVVCRSGYRSLLAAEFLRDRGFARASSLAGGMLAWVEAGQPVEHLPKD